MYYKYKINFTSHSTVLVHSAIEVAIRVYNVKWLFNTVNRNVFCFNYACVKINMHSVTIVLVFDKKIYFKCKIQVTSHDTCQLKMISRILEFL